MIKNDPAPPGYQIAHIHRENPDQTRGSGLAIIHHDSINVSPRNHDFAHTSFELQLVNIGLKSRDIVLANIYRPPSSSKSVFFDEFGLLLTNLGSDAVDRLMICGDFNLPGTSPDTIDNGLAELFHSTSFSQFVKSSTRHDSHHNRSSLLDHIITPSLSKLVTVTSVVSSHEISDHDLTLTNLKTRRYKAQHKAIFRLLTKESLLTLVHAFITSRVDHCNGVLYGSNGYLLHRLQSVLNSAARLILDVLKFDSVSAAIRNELHWLPIRKCIQFKIALLMRHCIVGAPPEYLTELCRPVSLSSGRQSLRSASRGDLIIPRFRL